MNKLFPLVILLVSAGNVYGQLTGAGDFIDSFANKNNFNGTTLVVKDPAISYHKSFGLVSFQWKVPHNTGTKYKVTSVTKLFTSVLVMQLYEKGKLDIYSTIGRYLPDYKGKAAGKVTIHQLLNHTSGLADTYFYRDDINKLVPDLPVYPENWYATGAMYSSATDLSLFTDALFGESC
ncbi:MAG TPA: serine hydrolase domain-containing protein [Chitinophagaceae bacterium]|nr:serine hydrolase domain-containing protein [Chitinophagaceae bacterium]